MRKAKKHRRKKLTLEDLSLNDFLLLASLDWHPDKTDDRCKVRSWADLEAVYNDNPAAFNKKYWRPGRPTVPEMLERQRQKSKAAVVEFRSEG